MIEGDHEAQQTHERLHSQTPVSQSALIRGGGGLSKTSQWCATAIAVLQPRVVGGARAKPRVTDQGATMGATRRAAGQTNL